MESARRLYDHLELSTDDAGARALVDGLGLRFDKVSTHLNQLDDRDPGWWALGKLYTYRAQTEAFIHIDSDVYLWKPLPQRITTAGVVAQNPERFAFGGGWYQPEVWQTAVTKFNGWLPPEWLWYTSIRGNEGACCGIFGGRNIEFIRHYAETAIMMIEDPRNRAACASIEKDGNNILFEQYHLCACVHFHSIPSLACFQEVKLEYLFRSENAAFDPDEARRVGYTHLIAGAKRNTELMGRLEKRVQRDYPEQYERALQWNP